MMRALSAWALAGICIVSAGCAVCASPYDECGPTFLGGCDEHCVTDDRAGSIISGHAGAYASAATPTPAADPAEEVTRPEPIPDPGMQQSPEEPPPPAPPAELDQSRQRSAYRTPTMQRVPQYSPMTLRPQQNRLR